MSILQVTIYAFTLWMGLYLWRRGGDTRGMRYAGLGMVLYALALALVLLATINEEAITWQPFVVLLAAPCWGLALWQMRQLAADLPRKRGMLVLAYLAGAFFLLTMSLIFVPQNLLTNADLLLALSIDVVLMGYAMAWLHTQALGEALLPDALRSLVIATAGCALLGSQVALIITLQTEPSPLAQVLFLEIISSLIILVIFSRPLLAWLDRLIYRDAPQVRTTRALLQEAADVMAHTDATIELLQTDEAEFTRLTRRALSNMTRPQRLVASPLLQLPLIEQHASYNAATDTTLERANILRHILSTSIDKLKPTHTDASSGITDEWRYYNAVYYPYVAGIKPFSSRLSLSELDEETRYVITWMRASVPERTLYNWQNAAAKLIAQDLREQLHA